MALKMVSVLYHHILFFVLLTPVCAGGTVKGTSTDLNCFRVEAPGEVTEGQTAVLTCSTTCNLTDPTFIWYKNGRPLTTNTTNQLLMQPISSEDAGSYSCAIRGYDSHSTAHNLSVRYSPKYVSVSVSLVMGTRSSGEVVEGSSVTMTCSSDANPPVEEYKWFKETQLANTGQEYTISNIRSQNSGEYKCKTNNTVGYQYSNGVTLDVIDYPNNMSASITVEITEGYPVMLTCNSDTTPPVKSYTWFKGSTPVGAVRRKTYSILKVRSEHSGEYTCQSRNEQENTNSTTVYLNVLYRPKRVSVSISPSGEIVEGSSVNLTCSSDANPPVMNYTWFKEGGTSPVGSGDSYSITSITAEDSGLYYCEAWNKLGQRTSAASFLHPVQNYISVYVFVGLACSGIVIVCFLYLIIRCAKRKAQNCPPVIDGTSRDQGSIHCDEVQTLPLNVPTNSAGDALLTHSEDGS